MAWVDATDFAKDVFGPRARVYSDGRSGGWLIVEGLLGTDERVEDWDAEQVAQWHTFTEGIQSIMADLDYQYFWHLYVNVYESNFEGFI